MPALYHLVSVHFSNLGSLGALFPPPSKSLPRLDPCSTILPIKTLLKCHFLHQCLWYPGMLRFLILWGPSTLYSYWPWTQKWFITLSFFSLLPCLLEFSITPSRSCPCPIHLCALRAFHSLTHSKCSINSWMTKRLTNINTDHVLSEQKLQSLLVLLSPPGHLFSHISGCALFL